MAGFVKIQHFHQQSFSSSRIAFLGIGFNYRTEFVVGWVRTAILSRPVPHLCKDSFSLLAGRQLKEDLKHIGRWEQPTIPVARVVGCLELIEQRADLCFGLGFARVGPNLHQGLVHYSSPLAFWNFVPEKVLSTSRVTSKIGKGLLIHKRACLDVRVVSEFAQPIQDPSPRLKFVPFVYLPIVCPTLQNIPIKGQRWREFKR